MSGVRGLIFAGDIYMEPFLSDGSLGAMIGPFEGGKFAMKPNSEQMDMISNGRDTFGQIVETVGVPGASDLDVTFNEHSPEIMALGLMGTVIALTQTAGSWTAGNEPPVLAKLDKWVGLPKAALGSAIVVKDSGGTTTFVEGTDYLLNRALGRVKAITGGAITDDQPLKLTGPYDAFGGSTILGMQQANLRVRFTLDGINYLDRAPCIVTVWEAVLASSEPLDFYSRKYATVSLKGRMKTPAGMTFPYKVDLRQPT